MEEEVGGTHCRPWFFLVFFSRPVKCVIDSVDPGVQLAMNRFDFRFSAHQNVPRIS